MRHLNEQKNVEYSKFGWNMTDLSGNVCIKFY